jgi:hypothetical protein
VVGDENLNILIAEELAAVATANIDNMARHLGVLFRVITLEFK